MKNFLNEWTNKFKRFLILLLLFVVIGLIFGISACMFLITNGKYDIEFYQAIAFIQLICMFIIVVFLACLIEYLETTDDMDKKIAFKKLEIEWEKVKKKE